MGIYFIVLFLTTCFAFLASQNYQQTYYSTHITKKLSFINLTFMGLSFIPPFIISAARYGIGTDFFNYQYDFYRINDLNIDTRFEIGYEAINKIAYFFGENFQVVIVITSFIVLSFVYLSIYRYSQRKWLSVFLFMAMTFYFASFNIIRQYLALSIVLLCFRFFVEKKTVRFLLAVTAASLFHTSILIFIPIYCFRIVRIKYTPFNTFLLLGGMFGAIIIFRPLLTSLAMLFYSAYVGMDLEVQMSFSRLIFEVGILGSAIVLFGKKTTQYQQSLIVLQIITLGVVFASAFVPYANRLLEMVQIFQIFLIPAMIQKINNKYLRWFIICGVLSFYAFYMYNSVYRLGSNGVYPYQINP